MKIVGTGVDLVEVARFRDASKRWGGRFLNRLFTPAERRYCADGGKMAAQRLAARFAGKEAVVKALGVPKGLGLEWQDLEIVRDPSGQPKVRFRGTMKRWKNLQVYLSLTHTRHYAVASATVVSR